MSPNTPSHCHLWHKQNLTTIDIALRTGFTVLKTFEDESHFIRRLLKCNDCGQLYFYEFREEIDWEGGNDPQYRTFIPIISEDEAEKLAKMQSFELLQFFPRLQSDWPADVDAPKVYWIGK